MVRKGIGSDNRIGSKFLYPGAGYGGSCFPKDVKALIRTGHQYNSPMTLLESVEAVNERQKKIMYKKFEAFIKEMSKGRKRHYGAFPINLVLMICVKRHL